ncbi:MAG TPA: TonB family protein [Polyangiaceae bacterium]|nr:TonB family protein [Polyangiaceae bacterium]
MSHHFSFQAFESLRSWRWIVSLTMLLFTSSSWGQVPGGAVPNVVPPSVLTHVEAVYPPSALAERRHADVVLTITVDVDGHVSAVDVASSGGEDLDQAAIVAVRQWTFVPAKRNGNPVSSRIRIPFHFAPPAAPPEVVEQKPGEEHELPSQPAVPAGSAGAPPSAAAASTAGKVGAAASAGSDQPNAAEVTVQGRPIPPSRGASDFNLRVGELARVPRGNATEMLKLAPGILLTNEGGEGHAEQVFLRGFDAREGQDIEFSVGGMPINEAGNLHGNGYADTHFIIPETVESLRVVEGPFDPRQGNFAVAGSANYELGLEKRGFTAKYLRGSFGTERLLLLYGPAEASARTFGAAEIYKTDGFGQNRDAQRATASGQYEGRLGDKGSYRITGMVYGTNYHSAGVIRDDDYRSERIGFYDSYDLTLFARQQTRQGGDATRVSLSGDLDTKIGDVHVGQQLFVISNGMRSRPNFTGFLLDVQKPAQRIHEQRGDMLDLDQEGLTFGARGSGKLPGVVFGQRQELEFGYFARGDKVVSSQQRLQAGDGVPYATETNLASKLGDIGLYVDGNLRLTSWLGLRGGVRSDLFMFNVNDLCAVQDVSRPSRTNPPGDASCLDQQQFGLHRETNQRSSTASTAVLPRASLILGPVDNFTFTASYGEGVRSIDPSYITQDIDTPFASIRAYEGGVAYAGHVENVAVVARSIFFQTHVDRDLIFSETAGRNVLGMGTTRTGWVGATRLTGSWFDQAANLTLVKSAYDDTHLLVAYSPDVVLRSDTATFSDLPFTMGGSKARGALSAGITYVGRRPLPLGERSQIIFTVDASATLGWKNFELGLVVTNLLDRRYRLGEYNFVSDFRSDPQPTLVPVRHFTAGAPRGVFMTFAVNLGGAS